MRFTIICVGKLKEDYLKDAAGEYLKRLRRYVKVDVVEHADEKAPESMSPAQEAAVKEKEGKRILKSIPAGDFVIALDMKGKQLSSENFASLISGKMTAGVGGISFIIGGSLGLSPDVVGQADLLLSFSEMTFPHQLMRVVLLEQIYRAEKIIANEPYHK